MCTHLFGFFWLIDRGPKNRLSERENQKPARSFIPSISFCSHQSNIGKKKQQLQIDQINPNGSENVFMSHTISTRSTRGRLTFVKLQVFFYLRGFSERTVSNRDFNWECLVKMVPIKRNNEEVRSNIKCECVVCGGLIFSGLRDPE